jgi:hypothetical protein
VVARPPFTLRERAEALVTQHLGGRCAPAVYAFAFSGGTGLSWRQSTVRLPQAEGAYVLCGLTMAGDILGTSGAVRLSVGARRYLDEVDAMSVASMCDAPYSIIDWPRPIVANAGEVLTLDVKPTITGPSEFSFGVGGFHVSQRTAALLRTMGELWAHTLRPETSSASPTPEPSTYVASRRIELWELLTTIMGGDSSLGTGPDRSAVVDALAIQVGNVDLLPIVLRANQRANGTVDGSSSLYGLELQPDELLSVRMASTSTLRSRFTFLGSEVKDHAG